MLGNAGIPHHPEGPSGETPNPAFLKDFEQKIVSYAQAMEKGNPAEAQVAALEAFALAAEEAQNHPTPSLLLKMEAEDGEARRDWAGAEAAYRKVLAVEEATGNHGLIAKAHMDLSKLLRLLGRLEEASKVATSATASARQAGIFPLLVMALENEISCDLARSEPQAALRAATEMVQAIEPGKLYDSMRARALINLARCLLATGDVTGAESNLAASWNLLQAPGMLRDLPGPIFVLANWWEAKSQVLEQQGEISAARDAMTESIEGRRQNDSPYGLLALIRSLERFSELSQRVGDLVQAESALAEATDCREDLRLPIMG